MERHEIIEAMEELKLHGMRASFDEIAGKGLARRDELYPLIASLIPGRAHTPAGPIDQLPDRRHQVPGAQGPGPVHLRRR